MTSALDLPVLKLNKLWTPVSIIPARKAFEDACAGAVTFLKFQEGYPSIFRIDDWMTLEVEDGQDFITTSRMHGLKKIAVPRVCICVTYDKLLAKEQPCTPDNLLKRYGHKDAVTQKPLDRKNFSKEHVTPKSKGGTKDWHNIVPMDRDLNSKRGNKSYRKIGYKKPKILGAPAPKLPIHSMVNTHGWDEWRIFHIPDPPKNIA